MGLPGLFSGGLKTRCFETSDLQTKVRGTLGSIREVDPVISVSPMGLVAPVNTCLQTTWTETTVATGQKPHYMGP